MRARLLCLFVALLAAAPVLWAPVSAEPVIRAHSENRGPGGGGEDAEDHDDDEGEGGVDGGVPAPAGDAGGGGAAPAAGPAAVTIANDAFSPARITVAAGTRVTWTNRDASRHTATASGGAFDSGTLGGGASFSFTFANPGTFAYFCAFHSDMQGSVTVTGAGGGAPAAAGTAASPTAAPTASTGPSTTAAPVQAATAPASDGAVEMKDYEFAPGRLTVGKGTKVTWTNTGRAPHTVTGDAFDSGEVASGQSFTHQFVTPGTYEYLCEIHPRMTGVIEVLEQADVEPVAAETTRFPIERVAAGGIIGAPVMLMAGALFFARRR